MGLGDGHTHRVPKPLPQRAGGHLHAGGVPAFRMSRGLAPPLAEPPQLVEREIITGQVKERIEQSRPMPGRKHEAVAVRPCGVGRRVLEKPGPKHVGHGSSPKRHARMSAVRALHCVHS